MNYPIDMEDILTRITNNETLPEQEAYDLMMRMTAGKCNDAQIAALLAMIQMRGVTVDEMIGFRRALLESRVPTDLSEYNAIDIVGTGGDGKDTFNISTCACFVVAGAGYKVAKHGNYGASSVSGASNVIESHGVKFTADIDRLRRSLDRCNIVYMHAQLFNTGMKHVGPVRKQLKVRTVFNLLGPLVNPSMPRRQLLGVADLKKLRLYVNVFQKLGMDFAVVTSLDGYDEISLTDKYKVVTNNYQKICTPEEIGMPRAKQNALYGGSTVAEAAAIFDDVLYGRATEAQRYAVVVNAAYAIQVLEPTYDIAQCLAKAFESLDSGKALATFKKYVELNS